MNYTDKLLQVLCSYYGTTRKNKTGEIIFYFSDYNFDSIYLKRTDFDGKLSNYSNSFWHNTLI